MLIFPKFGKGVSYGVRIGGVRRGISEFSQVVYKALR